MNAFKENDRIVYVPPEGDSMISCMEGTVCSQEADGCYLIRHASGLVFLVSVNCLKRVDNEWLADAPKPPELKPGADLIEDEQGGALSTARTSPVLN